MNDHAHGHPNVKLQTPNSKLQASNSKLRASNSKPQASNSKHEAVPFSASVEVSFCPENAATYSVGDEDQNLSGVFSKTHAFLRSSAPSLGWPYIRSAIFLADNTHAHCAYACSARFVPCRKLSLRSV